MPTDKTFGFKQLTVDNWLEGDNILTVFATLLPDGRIETITAKEWARRILEPQLDETVPSEIQRLFEVARGTMLYGFLFYPIYTLAIEQVSRVAETAVSHKCQTMGSPKKVETFNQRIDWLIQTGIISNEAAAKWHTIRGFRNDSSHPKDQTIFAPSNAIGILQFITEQINSLFRSQ